MLSMAIPALGHILDSSFKIGSAMDAVRVRKWRKTRLGFSAVTVTGGRAVDIRQIFFMRDLSFGLSRLNSVAISAAECSVR
jgi:hypothetical protein